MPGFGVWWGLAAGAWAGRLVFAAPDVTERLFDLGLALGSAMLIALSYRRLVRGYMEGRRRRPAGRRRA